jgi:hypothetical protein
MLYVKCRGTIAVVKRCIWVGSGVRGQEKGEMKYNENMPRRCHREGQIV